MEEQISDMSEVLQSLNNELQSMRQTIDAQYTMICQLNRNSEAQLKEIRSLREENTVLRTQLSKPEHPGKDSNNSSTPPSKENMKSETKRRTKSLREKSDKSIGGQPGHECYYPVRMIDWANTNPRYWDGNSQYKPGSTNIAFFEDRPNSVPPHPPLLKTFSHLDFLSNLHLNCDPPVTTINMQAGIPIGTIPNDISVLASRTWRLRVLQVRDKTTGSITITHPNAHP